MQKQRIFLIAGVVLALAVVYLIKVYLDQQREVLKEEAERAKAVVVENQVSVLVATQDIAKGAAIDPAMLEAKIFPKNYIAPQAVTSLDRIAGMIAVAQIPKGEQITLSKLSYPRQAGGLAEVTPVGKRAITINVDTIASVAGMIKPGDYVDLSASIPVPMQLADGKQTTQVATVPLFQNVLVLAVGQELGTPTAVTEGGRYGKQEAGQAKKEPSSLITLALNPQETNLVAFVQEQGKFRLVLRSPADSQVQPLTPITWEALFQYMMPSAKPEKQAAKQTVKQEPAGEAASTEYVEIYRGSHKEKIPLSK